MHYLLLIEHRSSGYIMMDLENHENLCSIIRLNYQSDPSEQLVFNFPYFCSS